MALRSMEVSACDRATTPPTRPGQLSATPPRNPPRMLNTKLHVARGTAGWGQ